MQTLSQEDTLLSAFGILFGSVLVVTWRSAAPRFVANPVAVRVCQSAQLLAGLVVLAINALMLLGVFPVIGR